MTQSAASLHASRPHPHPQGAVRQTRPRRRASRLIFWEWTVVLILLAGLGITVLVLLSRAPDPRRDADTLVVQMKAALAGKPLGASLFGTHPILSGAGRETVVAMSHVPPKVCVLASWDLYRLGTITINGVTPQRVSAAKLVELCNDADAATLLWSPK